MAKKISVTKKALIPGSIKPSRMSKGSQEWSPSCQRRFSQNDAGTSDDMDKSMEGGVRNTNNCDGNTTVNKLTSSSSKNEDAAHEVQNSQDKWSY